MNTGGGLGQNIDREKVEGDVQALRKRVTEVATRQGIRIIHIPVPYMHNLKGAPKTDDELRKYEEDAEDVASKLGMVERVLSRIPESVKTAITYIDVKNEKNAFSSAASIFKSGEDSSIILRIDRPEAEIMRELADVVGRHFGTVLLTDISPAAPMAALEVIDKEQIREGARQLEAKLGEIGDLYGISICSSLPNSESWDLRDENISEDEAVIYVEKIHYFNDKLDVARRVFSQLTPIAKYKIFNDKKGDWKNVVFLNRGSDDRSYENVVIERSVMTSVVHTYINLDLPEAEILRQIEEKAQAFETDITTQIPDTGADNSGIINRAECKGKVETLGGRLRLLENVHGIVFTDKWFIRYPTTWPGNDVEMKEYADFADNIIGKLDALEKILVSLQPATKKVLTSGGKKIILSYSEKAFRSGVYIDDNGDIDIDLCSTEQNINENLIRVEEQLAEGDGEPNPFFGFSTAAAEPPLATSLAAPGERVDKSNAANWVSIARGNVDAASSKYNIRILHGLPEPEDISGDFGYLSESDILAYEKHARNIALYISKIEAVLDTFTAEEIGELFRNEDGTENILSLNSLWMDKAVNSEWGDVCTITVDICRSKEDIIAGLRALINVSTVVKPKAEKIVNAARQLEIMAANRAKMEKVLGELDILAKTFDEDGLIEAASRYPRMLTVVNSVRSGLIRILGGGEFSKMIVGTGEKIINKSTSIDVVLGAIPGVGDGISAMTSLHIVKEAYKAGVPWYIIPRMLMNVAIDTGVGSVPVVGDLFDVVFWANARNVEIFRKYVRKYIAKHEALKQKDGVLSQDDDVAEPDASSPIPPEPKKQKRTEERKKGEGETKKKTFKNPLAGLSSPRVTKALTRGALRLGALAAVTAAGAGIYHEGKKIVSAPTEEKIKEASVVEKAEGIALGEVVHLTSKDEGVAKKVLIKVGKEYIPAVGFVWENEDDPNSIDVKRVQ